MSYYKPLSYWEQDAYFRQVDVAIIGGGIVGMNAALRLQEADSRLKVVIIERSSIGTAASSRNAGFACYGSPSEIMSDLQSMSEEDVYNLIKKRVAGLQLLKKIVGLKKLHYTQTGGHEVFIDNEEFELHLDHLASINAIVEGIDPELKFYRAEDTRGLNRVAGVISNDWEGQIHPGYMTRALRAKCVSQGINVLTNMEVERIESNGAHRIIGESLSIEAKKMIVCNNAFAKDLVQLETTAGRNQILLTSPIKDIPIHGNYHYDSGYVYFRQVDDRVLIGGGRNTNEAVESTDNLGETDQIKKYLINILKKHILIDKQFEIEYSWSGILGFNKTKKPIIREVELGKFVAVGLGGMGVAIGTLVGRDVADLLLQS